MKNLLRNYEEIMKKYKENMKKSEGITRPIHGQWDLGKFRARPARRGVG